MFAFSRAQIFLFPVYLCLVGRWSPCTCFTWFVYVFNVKLQCYILKLSITILSLSNTGCSFSAVMTLICNAEVNLGGNLV